VATPNNLPAELTSFVGREPQLAELRRLLRKSRLITLTGPGGAGKTRLAVRLAAGLLDRHPDGVWLVDLSALGDDSLLEHTVASICGVKEEAKLPVIDALAKGLGGKRAVIVLDGCEHLVDSCAALAGRLLGSCPELHILATSREPLGVPGEVIWRTPSLTIPRPQDAGHPELLLESEAIRLFVERATLSRPDFELQASSSSALAQICARLEGIPLAIELAAGLAGVMTLQEILERLRDRFRLLTGGNRGRATAPSDAAAGGGLELPRHRGRDPGGRFGRPWRLGRGAASATGFHQHHRRVG
jgi:predicted ATPase